MSLFIRDDIPVRQLSPLYKKHMRMKAHCTAQRQCVQWMQPMGYRRFLPYRIAKDYELLYLKGA